jgi:GDPmannose 4,6-dehydratase
MNKVALISGLSGQDGGYLAELLLEKGYKVYGMVRRSANTNYWRLEHILDKVTLLDGDLTDLSSIIRVVEKSNPDEIYHLGAQSFVAASWDQPILTADITGLGSLRVLEAVRLTKKNSKIYLASSSEQFGKVHEVPQKETTIFHPRSPYGQAKVFAHHSGVNYRESYGMYICCGILFNHESPRRGLEFVTRKITNGVARIKQGLDSELRLGNIESKRDWGHAKDYVKAMYLMMQQETPDDYVIATGETHSVKEFCEVAFKHVGLDYTEYVIQDPKFYRPAEVDLLIGDYSKAKAKLGWIPEISFETLVKEMVDADMERVTKQIKNKDK